MSQTGIRSFDREINVAMDWMIEFDDELGWDDRQKTYQAVRATFHALRDRLTVEEAAHLAAQLPTFLRGVYYEAYKPASTPTKIRNPEEFYDSIREEFQAQPVVDAARISSCVFTVLSNRVADGEIEEIIDMFPEKLRHLWPGEERGEGPQPGQQQSGGDTGGRPRA